MHEGLILSGANFVPLGNNLSNRIREKEKGKTSWETTNFRVDSEAIKSEKRTTLYQKVSKNRNVNRGGSRGGAGGAHPSLR